MRALVFFLAFARPAFGCDLALLFAVDVSGSVDRGEYQTQMEGLALALRDDQIADALVSGGAALALIQWTGASRQRLTVPWTRIETHENLSAFADRVARDPRIWRNFSTAIGEALSVALAAFDDAPACARRVIDVSSDGVSNEGVEPSVMRARAQSRDVTVNALVIEDATEGDLTGYFFENVIAGPGAFLVSADGYEDYPYKMRQKLLREAIEVFGSAGQPHALFTAP
ncbi:MAG: DUF1194 domain-containing protein [Pseudomonadota bacterium]